MAIHAFWYKNGKIHPASSHLAWCLDNGFHSYDEAWAAGHIRGRLGFGGPPWTLHLEADRQISSGKIGDIIADLGNMIPNMSVANIKMVNVDITVKGVTSSSTYLTEDLGLADSAETFWEPSAADGWISQIHKSRGIASLAIRRRQRARKLALLRLKHS